MSKAKTATIKLQYPVQLPDRLMTDVTMRRPTVGDLIKNPIVDNADLQGEFSLLCNLCGLNPDDAEHLDAFDYDALREQYVFFRADSQPKKPNATGPTTGTSGAMPVGNGS